VLSERLVNYNLLQFFRSGNERTANTLSPAIQVLGSFNGGGAQVGRSSDLQNNYEFQDYMTLIRAAHTWRFGVRLRGQIDDNVSPQNFGGTFTFGGGIAPALDANSNPVLDASDQPILVPITSIERYRRTLFLERLGFSVSQIRSLGGGATQFSVSAGNPSVSANQWDTGAFIGDDWKVRSSLTLTLGLRYETQTNIHDWRDFAPRLGVAWAPGGSGSNPRSKTVVRAGFGAFYDRFGLGNTLNALRYNGAVQQQFVLTDPDFFPSIPSISSLTDLQSTQIRQQVSPDLHAPYILQSAAGIERQLPFNTTVAITYTNSHGLHTLRSRDLNAPLPGTYDPNITGSGIFPLGAIGALFVMESSGLYNQNQLTVNVNTKARNVSLAGSYSLNLAMSNTDGLGTFPANPYRFVGEYGPASTDVRHRVSLGASMDTKWNVAFSPLVNVTSGPPFDITVGRDIYGTTLFNGRPGIATDRTKPGVVKTVYGLLDPNPTPDERIVHRNYGRGPGTVSLNLRVAKTLSIGPRPAQAAQRGSRSSSRESDVKRPYTLRISMETQNILNHTNPGPIIGNITSPLFGHANQPAGGGGFGGFSEAANNRRLELQTRFTF